jgi:hypothetical protein
MASAKESGSWPGLPAFGGSTVADGSITDAKIAAGANIAQSKVSGLASALAGKMPLGSLMYNVRDYGALGNGSADDSAAIQAAINACASTGGKVWFPYSASAYSIQSALSIKAHVNLVGVGQGSRINAVNNHLFVWTSGRLTDFSIRDMKLTVASGGHIFSAGTYGADQCVFEKVQCVQNAAGYSIWNQDNTDSFIEVSFMRCDLWMSGAATVPAFNIRGTGGALNNNTWTDCRFNGQGNTTTPFVRIEEYGTTFSYNNTFRGINSENCPGGIIEGYSAQGWILEKISHWDILHDSTQNTLTRDAIKFGKGSGGSSPLSRDVKIAQYKRQAPGNIANTTLTAALTDTTGTTVAVTSAANFPPSGSFYVIVDSEVMQVTAGQGTTTWTVSRGAQGTTAATHSNGATVTAYVFDINAASAGFVDGTLFLDGVSTSGVTGVSVNAKNYVALNSVGNSQLCDLQIFTANGTWTKPVWAGPNAMTHVICVSGGGGGGSGAVQATGVAAGGGAGGGSGGKAEARLPTSSLPSSVSVLVGTGGTGGAAVSANSTNGNPGGNPGTSSFSTYVLTGVNATGGGGGTVTTSTAGAGATSLIGSSGSGGAGGTNGAAGSNGASGTISGGGGGGGGITSGEVTSAGGAGRTGTSGLNTTYAGGASVGAAGTAGASQPVNSGLFGGSGGGGASGDATHNGGDGANGGIYGAAGGGGGGTRNGMTSGKGGNGANGIVIVITTP